MPEAACWHEGLGMAAADLERLDEEGAACGDPTQGIAIEKWIIWRELLDLELSEFNEQIERLSEVAAVSFPRCGNGRAILW